MPTWKSLSDVRTREASSIELLRLRLRLSVPAKINARIGHLAKSKSAALEHTHTPAGAATRQQLSADELLGCEIAERRSLKRHQHRTHPRFQGAVELLVLRISPLGNSGW